MTKTLRSRANALLIREIRSARQNAGMSQKDVADQLGVPQSYVAKVELGERRIDVIEFLALTAVINASWKEILDRVDTAKA